MNEEKRIKLRNELDLLEDRKQEILSELRDINNIERENFIKTVQGKKFIKEDLTITTLWSFTKSYNDLNLLEITIKKQGNFHNSINFSNYTSPRSIDLSDFEEIDDNKFKETLRKFIVDVTQIEDII